ncbi:hypothetical protein WMF31_13080 [Sorangium sp. So ce1036]
MARGNPSGDVALRAPVAYLRTPDQVSRLPSPQGLRAVAPIVDELPQAAG